jgi:hypothetical protein
MKAFDRRRRRRIIARRYAQTRSRWQAVIGGVLVSGLLLALCTVWPAWAALFVVVPFMALLGLSAIGDAREGRHA